MYTHRLRVQILWVCCHFLSDSTHGSSCRGLEEDHGRRECKNAQTWRRLRADVHTNEGMIPALWQLQMCCQLNRRFRCIFQTHVSSHAVEVQSARWIHEKSRRRNRANRGGGEGRDDYHGDQRCRQGTLQLFLFVLGLQQALVSTISHSVRHERKRITGSSGWTRQRIPRTRTKVELNGCSFFVADEAGDLGQRVRLRGAERAVARRRCSIDSEAQEIPVRAAQQPISATRTRGCTDTRNLPADTKITQRMRQRNKLRIYFWRHVCFQLAWRSYMLTIRKTLGLFCWMWKYAFFKQWNCLFSLKNVQLAWSIT